MQIDLAVPTSTTLNLIGTSAFEIAESIVIDSPAMLTVAGAELVSIKKKQKELNEKRKAITGPLDTAKKQIMELFNGPLDWLGSAERILEAGITNYQNDQRKIAAEAQRKLDEEAAKERAKLAAEAAEIAAKAKEAEDKLLAEAKAATAAGYAELAEKLQAEADEKAEAAASNVAEVETRAAMTVAPIIVPQKIAGVSGRDKWEADVTDKAVLVAFIATNPGYLNLLDINQGALNKLAGVMKAEMKLPGTQVRCGTVISVRSA